MIKGQMLKEVRFRNGHIIPKGDTIIVNWTDPKLNAFQVEVHHRGTILSSPAATALAWIGLTVSREELESAIFDGTCETPAGNSVEPDGVDSQGVPSWLGIHGLI
jgi:hypothetical protein